MSCIHDLVRNQDTYRADVEQTVLAVVRPWSSATSELCPCCATVFWLGFSERDFDAARGGGRPRSRETKSATR
jgi:hypothetical protein